jgi:N-6 DNA Methylase
VTLATASDQLTPLTNVTTCLRLGSPGAAVTMTSRIESPKAAVNVLVGAVSGKLDKAVGIQEVFDRVAPRSPNLGFDPLAVEPAQRLAWHLVASWLVGYSLGFLDDSSNLEDANEWFFSGSMACFQNVRDIETSKVSSQISPAECYSLLPYLLDPLGLGTRRGAQKSIEEQSSRQSRKAQGLFYTPMDVAYFMADRLMRERGTNQVGTVLDPAAGSGVFLRAASMAQLASNECRYFGVDLAPLASEFASYVLLATNGFEDWPSPWAKWHAIRIDQATSDTLFLPHKEATSDLPEIAHLARRREATLAQLQEGKFLDADRLCESPSSLTKAFPELGDGAQLVLSNPPYSPLGERANDPLLRESLHAMLSTNISSATNIYPYFIEKAIEYSGQYKAISLVVPLSITYGTDRILRTSRQSLVAQDGKLEFLSFDRTPDSLFGDDVKTRNAIVNLVPESKKQVSTTGLMRWTSRTRDQFFESINSVQIDSPVDEYVPKIGTQHEATFFQNLLDSESSLGGWILTKSAARLLGTGDELRVSKTAYNWIGCVPDVEPLQALGHDADSTFSTFQLRDGDHLYAMYSILTSRTAYFMWRTRGDGFHVSKSFVTGLPAPSDEASIRELAQLGREIWARTQARSVVSTNRGSRTVSFIPPNELVEEADCLLLRSLGIACPFDLAEWYMSSVVVDRSDSRRMRRFPSRESI